ncbi:MAG: PaaI family thioesterase [Marinobacterium sp.]|nr:PaaI family thioesterase [Marinobacterium sp.]
MTGSITDSQTPSDIQTPMGSDSWQSQNPDWRAEVERVFYDAPFIQSLGAEMLDVSPGYCRSRIMLDAHHLQQDGYVHAGVQATLADHTAGTAAAALLPAGHIVLTAEFKINLLRAAKGQQLIAEGRVLKPGNMLTIAETEVFVEGDKRQLVAKATVTLANVAC